MDYLFELILMRLSILLAALLPFICKLAACSVEFHIAKDKIVPYSNRHCPINFTRAVLNTEELWRAAVNFSFSVMGHDQRVWIKQALNWSGDGTEEWMISTPTDPSICIFPPESLDKFCVPNEHGKLSINKTRKQKYPNLCMREK